MESLTLDIISRAEIIGRLGDRLLHMLSPAYRNLFVDYHTITKKDDRVDLVFTFFLTEPRSHEGLLGSNTIGYELKTLPKFRIPYKGWNIKEDKEGLNALLDAHIEKITSELSGYFGGE